MQLADTIELAWNTVRVNKLRTGITVAIIALGIMALIGIITAIQAMNQSLRESFSTMGANSFSIRYKDRNFFRGDGRRSVTRTTKSRQKERRSNLDKWITYEEATAFKNRFEFPAAATSISIRGASQIVQFISPEKIFKTNPDVNLLGGDENYLELNGYKIERGRNFTDIEVSSGANSIILGAEVCKRCFEGRADKAIGKTVKVGNLPYQVVGVLQAKGASAFLNLDNVVIATVNNVRRMPGVGGSFSVGVMVKDYNLLDNATGQATGVFRGIRKLDIYDADNFAIDKSDALAEQFIGFLSGISGAAGVIGFITLIGAAIGLMNIMLVAVTERTKEVGLTKAIGATRKGIRMQFLIESILISLMGACIGIVLGVAAGNLIGLALGTGFLIPWFWVLMGVLICFTTGLLAGILPASKAAKLDPIVALRYE